ncbi:DUF3800 domain-containing protein [Geodermatophilus sp. CPCC 205761]|uniref:DUF3800 domain-containing protein n=1 Tax=Geodermatophilus sp. CPCC 205761 TaxID=2936597 RepID=UPI003EEF6F28
MAYVDESGDSGYSGSRTYTLGCVLVEADRWPDTFDSFISFRRFVAARFGVRVRAEVKANHLVGGRGALSGLGEKQRHAIYRQHMRLAEKLGLRVFAVVIQKDKIKNQNRNPRDIAWEFLLQRLERASDAFDQPIWLTHDEGESAAIRKLARKARRIGKAGSRFGTGTLKVPFRLLLDDPVPRDSAQSYFIQLADLAAYAAFRSVQPPSPKRATVCPQTMWSELGKARHSEANGLARTTGDAAEPGVVVWPRT